jgi:hypothetical protein
MWYHDAADHEDHEDHPASAPGGDEHPLQPLCADKYLKKSPVPTQAGGLRGALDAPLLYGSCMDCGIGLNDANEFFYDRRQKQCDCFTCNTCFETTFGKDELFNSANWKTLGIQAPQYIRVTW